MRVKVYRSRACVRFRGRKEEVVRLLALYHLSNNGEPPRRHVDIVPGETKELRDPRPRVEGEQDNDMVFMPLGVLLKDGGEHGGGDDRTRGDRARSRSRHGKPRTWIRGDEFGGVDRIL